LVDLIDETNVIILTQLHIIICIYLTVENAQSGQNWIGPIQYFSAETDRRFSTGPVLTAWRGGEGVNKSRFRVTCSLLAAAAAAAAVAAFINGYSAEFFVNMDIESCKSCNPIKIRILLN